MKWVSDEGWHLKCLRTHRWLKIFTRPLQIASPLVSAYVLDNLRIFEHEKRFASEEDANVSYLDGNQNQQLVLLDPTQISNEEFPLIKDIAQSFNQRLDQENSTPEFEVNTASNFHLEDNSGNHIV